MRYWNEHPEQYDAVIRRGIQRFIEARLMKHGFPVPGEWANGYEALIETVQLDPLLKDMYNDLLSLSTKEITNEETSYWNNMTDNVREGMDDGLPRV